MAEPKNAARETFDKAYEKVFGEQGASFHYKVNIIGVYKTEGDLWQKGKKSKSVSERSIAWNDGKDAYVLYRKKKEVEHYRATDPEKDKHASKFTFYADDYEYDQKSNSEGLLLTLKYKKGMNMKGVSEARILLNPTTLVPSRLRIKVAFVWTTVNISNFRQGNIDESLFVFPKTQYASCKMIDKTQK